MSHDDRDEEGDARLTNATLTLMEAAEGIGRPAIAVDIAKRDMNYFRCVVSMNGTSEQIDQVLGSLKAGWPDAEVTKVEDVLHDILLQDDDTPRGEA